MAFVEIGMTSEELLARRTQVLEAVAELREMPDEAMTIIAFAFILVLPLLLPRILVLWTYRRGLGLLVLSLASIVICNLTLVGFAALWITLAFSFRLGLELSLAVDLYWASASMIFTKANLVVVFLQAFFVCISVWSMHRSSSSVGRKT